ncbi:MAG TPA: hypothetical protein VHG27_02185, partial [Xanthobacteraceae bacterium]|nr:hypothetical protein [Xanthobacteraceae bacterium]
VDINRIGFFSPLRRRAIMIGGISADGEVRSSPTDPRRYERGAISFAVLFPKLLENYQFRPRSQFGEVCLPVPTPDQAPYLTLTR